MKSLKVIGLNSGTSMDGIDAALFVISPAHNKRQTPDTPPIDARMQASRLSPFDQSFQTRLKKLVAGGQASLDEITRLNAALGELFADAALAVVSEAGLSISDVDLIGSHGQTIWHAPSRRPFWGVASAGTMQLGEPAIIAARTGVPVVGDFRVQDMAFGGQGAPLVSFADEVLFGGQGVPTGVLNLGGIANITVIDRRGRAVVAFDSGPGNMVIDRAAEVLFGQTHDVDGQIAARGAIDEDWLQSLLAYGYFHQPPPKTTGREMFGKPYADKLIAEGAARELTADAILATLTALTAFSIIESYVRFVESRLTIERLVLGGGGADNRTLNRLLADFWPHKIKIMRHEDFGISTKFKEALLFALLAYTTYHGIPNNVPVCTGATRRTCLGKLCRP